MMGLSLNGYRKVLSGDSICFGVVMILLDNTPDSLSLLIVFRYTFTLSVLIPLTAFEDNFLRAFV